MKARLLTLLFALSLSLSAHAQTYTETILHSFFAFASDGSSPGAGVVLDSSGNLYGTTEDGGASGCGILFELSSVGVETILYNFGCAADGGHPQSTLLLDPSGNLYGTTAQYGTLGQGVLFKFATSTGIYSVLHQFGATGDGQNPAGTLTQKSAVIYGVTGAGGTNGCGTVWKYASGTETVLYSFACAPDGKNPRGGVILDLAGNLYGTTLIGGANLGGTAFELTAGSGHAKRSAKAVPGK